MQKLELTVVIGAGRYPEGSTEIGIRGGAEDSLIPSLVMEASIKRHSPDTRVINTYGIDKPWMSSRKNPTPFSLVRFMVPALCGFNGWAVYCDADQVVLDDIRKILDAPEMATHPVPVIYVAKKHGCTGVILMDTSRLKHWDGWEIKEKIDNGSPYGPMMRDLNGHRFDRFGDFGVKWNSRDATEYTSETKLIHFTNLATQPWKVPGKHALEHIWASQLKAAIDDGFVKEDDLDENCRKILETLHAKSTPATIS